MYQYIQISLFKNKMLLEPDMFIYLHSVYIVAFMLQETCIVETETGPQSLTCLLDGLSQKNIC